MKKMLSVFLAIIVMLCSAASAATIKTKGGIIGPEPTTKDLAGLVIDATVHAYNSETSLAELTLYECVAYKAEEINALAEGDVLKTDEKEYIVQTITRDEENQSVIINDGDYENGFMTLRRRLDDRGDFYAAYEDDTEYPMYHALCTVKVPVSEDIAVADFSDPGNSDGIITRGLEELLRVKAEREENSIGLDKKNTAVYFDQNGNLIRVELQYTPWN